jgi:membrane-bound lytic murein transglycosylase B
MRQNLKTTLAAGLAAFLLAGTVQAQTATAPAAACGGDLNAFLQGVKAEALTRGVSADVADRALAGAAIDQKVLSRDRAQGVFRQTFLEFSKRTVSQSRLDIGRKKLKDLSSVFARAEQEFGVPGPIIAAFWAMETDFGAVQGDFNTRNALVTLSHDCRRNGRSRRPRSERHDGCLGG